MFENEYRFPIMGSTALKGKAPAAWRPSDWQRFHRSFGLMNVTPREMAIHVWRGYSFTPVFTEARREEFYKWAYHIALDFDAGDETSSLPFLLERPGTFAWMFASFGYSTPSSTPEHPRSRVVFVLDFPLLTPAEYRAAISRRSGSAIPSRHFSWLACRLPSNRACVHLSVMWLAPSKRRYFRALLEHQPAQPINRRPVAYLVGRHAQYLPTQHNRLVRFLAVAGDASCRVMAAFRHVDTALHL